MPPLRSADSTPLAGEIDLYIMRCQVSMTAKVVGANLGGDVEVAAGLQGNELIVQSQDTLLQEGQSVAAVRPARRR